MAGVQPPRLRVCLSDAVTSADLDFTCPRCASAATARFYGPCPTCRADLAASLGGASREVEAEAYEPKMNVVPNAVATKD